jgi:hypothetical protein
MPVDYGNPFSLRDDSRDGGGRTKFGTRVEKATPPGMEVVDRVGNKRSRMRGHDHMCFTPLTLTLSQREREFIVVR